MAINKAAVRAYLQEQQRFHDELTTSFGTVSNRLITYIGAILAVLVFLYAGALDASKSTPERLFIPEELYGKIFYFFGLFLLLYALSRLVHGARPHGDWHVAYHHKDNSLIEHMSEEDYLVKLKNDYYDARTNNLAHHDKKHEALRDAFYPMLLGAILLVVLRYFQ